MKVNDSHRKAAETIYKFILKNDRFLLSAHINADGDAVASVIATGLLLEKLQKTYFMVLHDEEVDTRFNYLKNYEKILHYKDDLNLQIENAIILDVPGVKRLGDVHKLLPGPQNTVKIDHHPPEDYFADLELADERASSTAQLVYDIFEVAGITADLEIAKAIYTGIVYDTGRFSFSNTTARDMYICARMIECGVEPAEITNRIFFENSFEALRIIGKGLASMESHLNGRVNIIYLNYESIKGNHQSEVEELANYSVAIKGGEIGLFVREYEPDRHKISLRSKGLVDVNQVAKAFNGGGHTRAAGCRIDGPKNEVILKLVREIGKRL